MQKLKENWLQTQTGSTGHLARYEKLFPRHNAHEMRNEVVAERIAG